MLNPIRLLSLLTVTVITSAQSPLLTLNVTNTSDDTTSNVVVKCKEGCPPATSDPNGTAMLKLMPDNVASGIVELQIVKLTANHPDWVLISPWDGKWPVAKKNCTVVVARKGDRDMLRSGKAVETIIARLLKDIKPKLDKQISEEERQVVLRMQAQAVGLTPEELDRAIRELGTKSEDPYQQGLAAMYEKNYPQATKLLAQSYQIRKDEYASSAFFLGQSLYQQGNYREAVDKFKEANALRKDDEAILNWLGLSLYQMGRYAEAEPLFKRNFDLKIKTLGSFHPESRQSLNDLALLYQSLGKSSEAEPLLKQEADFSEKAFSSDPGGLSDTLNNLAVIYYAKGSYSEAERLLNGALRNSRGMNNPAASAQALNNLGTLYLRQDKYNEAEPPLKEALEIREKNLGPEHPDTAQSRHNLAQVYKKQSKHAEAESLYQQSLKIKERVLGKDHPSTATTLSGLADLYLSQGKYSEAEPLLKRAQAIFENTLGNEHLNVATTLDGYAELLRKTNRADEAAKLEARAKAIREKAQGRTQ